MARTVRRPREERVPKNAIHPPTKAPRQAHAVTFHRPWLYPKQLAAIFNPSRYVVVEAATKTGKTVGCIAWLGEQCALRGGPNRNFWWVAPSGGQADIAFRRFIQYCPPDQIIVNYTRSTITFPNGGRIWFKTAEKPDLLYGEDVYAVVMDEATRMREASWTAIRSTLTATKGPCRVIGNVKGKKNWAYRMARRAESGARNMHHARLNAYDAADAGIFSVAEIEDARASLNTEAFNELYLALPSEDGANPFGIQNLDDCAIQGLANGPVAYFGIDLGRAVDWTVILGLNKYLSVCHFDRFQRPWPETIDTIIKTVGQKPCLIDSTGLGDPVTQLAQKKVPNMEAFVFSQRSKQDLMEGLAINIQRHRLGIPGLLNKDADIPASSPAILMRELRDFEYTYKGRDGRVTGVTYEAPEGLHDDAVCALALANRMATVPQVPIAKPHGEGVYAPYAV